MKILKFLRSRRYFPANIPQMNSLSQPGANPTDLYCYYGWLPGDILVIWRIYPLLPSNDCSFSRSLHSNSTTRYNIVACPWIYTEVWIGNCISWTVWYSLHWSFLGSSSQQWILLWSRDHFLTGWRLSHTTVQYSARTTNKISLPIVILLRAYPLLWTRV